MGMLIKLIAVGVISLMIATFITSLIGSAVCGTNVSCINWLNIGIAFVIAVILLAKL